MFWLGVASVFVAALAIWYVALAVVVYRVARDTYPIRTGVLKSLAIAVGWPIVEVMLRLKARLRARQT